MTAVKLLPLPAAKHKAPRPIFGGSAWQDAYIAEEVTDYAHANMEPLLAEIDALRTRLEDTVRDSTDKIEELRNLCGMAYQLAGVHDAPEAWLDALSNAAVGVPFETEGLLPYMPESVASTEALRAEVDRLKRVEFCWDEWLEKTEWVQRTCKPKELGMHRADVLRLRIDQAEARADRLAEALRLLNSATRRYMEERPQSDAEWASDEPSVLSVVDAALEQEGE